MKNKFTKILIIIFALFGLFITSTPVFAYDICTDANVPVDTKKSQGCPGYNTTSLDNSIISILNGIIGILAVVAVVVIVIGGVQYMISAGEPSKTKKAKDTILYAAIGLIICALAAVIVNFVVANLLGNGPTKEPEEGYITTKSQTA